MYLDKDALFLVVYYTSRIHYRLRNGPITDPGERYILLHVH